MWIVASETISSHKESMTYLAVVPIKDLILSSSPKSSCL